MTERDQILKALKFAQEGIEANQRYGDGSAAIDVAYLTQCLDEVIKILEPKLETQPEPTPEPESEPTTIEIVDDPA